MPVIKRPYVTAGVVVIGIGLIAAVPVPAGLPDVEFSGVQVAAVRLTAGEQPDIIIDVVRHGQRLPPQNDEVTPSPDHPGPPLSDLGQQQAQDVGHQLYNELGPHVAGIFSGQAIRDQDTAAPFAALENMSNNVQILPGLNEIDSGIYADAPLSSPGGFLYEVTPLLWTLFGLLTVPIPGSGEDYNGVIFNQKFTDAVDTMYQAALANPVVSDNGHITDVAFNNEADIAAWVALNVKNPDVSFLLPLTLQTVIDRNDGMPLLPNTGVVQIEGNPTDGWTLVSWNGTPISPQPDLLTSLLMDLRHLVVVQQTEQWNISQAFLDGDPTTIENALQTGMNDISTAIAQFPQAVITDITDAFSHTALS